VSSSSVTLPRLLARFEIDERGAPAFFETGGKRHYKIVYEVENAPEGTYAATFELDPSYYDPYRTLTPDTDGKFRLTTTAYGDYGVMVRLRTKEGEVPLPLGTLSMALQNARQHMGANPAVDEAVEYIASH
jgi:pYEATS domain-containing protein involved in immunity